MARGAGRRLGVRRLRRCGRAGATAARPAYRRRAVAVRRRDSRAPYWLGPRFDGLAVTHVSRQGGQVGLTYGRWTCDSGCTDSGGVWTGRREIGLLSRFDYANTGIDPADCWTRVGKAVAVLLGCDPNGYPQELAVYSGTREIYLTSLYTDDGRDETAARTVVQRLRPLNAHAPWPLARPKPLSCSDFRRVDRRYRRAMPPPLRPRTRC